MIILFNKEEKLFQTLGLGVLKDAISCVVTEELNGSFELEMEYPLTGSHYSDIDLQKLLLVAPNMYDQSQPFRIYSISKPMNGQVIINAEHISYDTSGHVVRAFKGDNLQEVMEKIQNEAVPQSSFIFLANEFTLPAKDTSMETDQPYSQRSLLAGQEGSLLDTYGGDYKFDRFNIYILNNRGQDRGLSIRYGKNLIDLEDESSSERLFTGIFPFYSATINETTTSSNSHYQEVWIVEGTVEYAGNWLSLSEGGKSLIPIIENSPVQIQTQNPLYYEKVLYFKYAVTGTNQFDVYIRSGTSEYSSSWLSKTNGGAALVPEKKIIYRIISEGDYIYNTFIWDGSKYVNFIGTGFYYEYEKNAEGQYIFEEEDEEGHLIIKILKPLLTKITSDTKERKVYLDLTQDELNRWPNGIMYAPGQETTSPQKILTLNMTDKHPEEPSFEEFWSKAEDYMNNNDLQKIVNNLTVSFVKLSDSPEYETFKELEKVELGDKISVIYEKLGVNSKLQVITTVFNVLTNKYDEIELGTKSASLTDSALTTGDSISALTNDANYTDRISVVNLLAQNITADYITGKNADLTEAMIKTLKTARISVEGLIEANQGVFDELIAQLLITENAEIKKKLAAGEIEVKGKITALSGEIHASIRVGRNVDDQGNVSYNFEVDKDGNATAKSVTITGGEIHLGHNLYGDSNFSVDPNGTVVVNDIRVSGGEIKIGEGYYQTYKGTRVDVPYAIWTHPIVVGTDIYFTGYDGYYKDYIGKFDTLTQTGTRISVPNGAWSQHFIVVDHEIYVGAHDTNTSIGKFDTLTQTGTRVAVPSGNWAYPVRIGNDIYFGTYGSSTSIGKFNILTQTGTRITVPSGYWRDPVVVGTDIYFGSSINTSTSIGKFDTLTQTGTRISVPSYYWNKPVVVGTDIYYYGNSTSICRFNTLTQTGTRVAVPSGNWICNVSYPVVVGTDIYYPANDSTNSIGKFDTIMQKGTRISVPNDYWTYPVVVGTDIYFGSWIPNEQTNSIGKFDTVNQIATRIIVPMEEWSRPIYLNGIIYFGCELENLTISTIGKYARDYIDDYVFLVDRNGNVKAKSFSLIETDPNNPETNVSIMNGKLRAQDADIYGQITSSNFSTNEIIFDNITTLKKSYENIISHTVHFIQDYGGTWTNNNKSYSTRIEAWFWPLITNYNMTFESHNLHYSGFGIAENGDVIEFNGDAYFSSGTTVSNNFTINFPVSMNINKSILFSVFPRKVEENIISGVHSLDIDSHFSPAYSYSYDLGTDNKKWRNIYATNGLIQTSDQKEKKDINYDISKYEKFFDLLKPTSFKFIKNESGRTHLGFISQDIEKALEESGLTSLEFAGFIKTLNSKEKNEKYLIDEDYIYGLRYSELHALEIQQIQQLKQQVKELQEIILKKEE